MTPPGLILGREAPPHGAQVLRFDNLGAAVCADGANGLTKVSAAEARARGLFVAPGQELVPLIAYWPKDPGRPHWQLPRGLDNPANYTGAYIIQGPLDPVPGALLSKTALRDRSFQADDPHSYFDSAAAAGWVLPGDLIDVYGVDLGDLAAVSYKGKTVWCQGYDVGPRHSERIELSVEACRQLGIPDCARSGGTESGVSVVILPGSRRLYSNGARPRPWTAEGVSSIAEQARKYMEGK